MIQTGMLDLVITLSIIPGSIPFPCTPTPTLTFRSTLIPSIFMTTLYFTLPVHSNIILRSRQLYLLSITMARSQHTRIPQLVPPSILQNITRRLDPLIPPLHLHRNRCTTMSICISVVRMPICGTSDPCRTTLATGPPTCPPPCNPNTYTITPTKLCSTPSQVLVLHQLRILPLLLSPCSMSILLKSCTPSTPIHTRMV